MVICSGAEGAQGLLEADGTENMTRWHSRVTEASLIHPDQNPSMQRTLEGAGVSHCTILLRTHPTQLRRLKQATLSRQGSLARPF